MKNYAIDYDDNNGYIDLKIMLMHMHPHLII